MSIILMALNIIISSLAVYRDYERHKEIKPKNQIDVFLDKYYPREVIEKVYNNAVYVSKEKNSLKVGKLKLL